MTTKMEAFEAILRHHADLGARASGFAEAVKLAAKTDTGNEQAVADFAAFFGAEILPHAMAEEHSIYPAVAEHPEWEDTVAEMIDEHRRIAAAVEELAAIGDAERAEAESGRIVELFATHVSKENELLLPVLLRDDAVDLVGLLGQMHDLTEAAKEGDLEFE